VLLLVRSLKAAEEYENTCSAHQDKLQPKEEQEPALRNEYLYDSSVQALLTELDAGIAKHPPQCAEEGTSGVYFMKNALGRKVAVFKPRDEEGTSLENLDGCELRPGCAFGEGYLKEVAASLLDRDGFHGVPKTTIATYSHPVFDNTATGGVPQQKEGSLQEYVAHESTAEEMGWNKFSARDVHKIGLLDCRILNLDRHLGNMLVTEEEDGACQLVPIDHAFSFPSSISGGASFEWLQFPQCKQPFDEDTVKYICSIDVEKDVQTIRQQLPSLGEECIETMKICTIFVKKAVTRGLSLYQIGTMMTRNVDNEEPSQLERAYARIQERATAQHEQDDHPAAFWDIVSEELDTTLA